VTLGSQFKNTYWQNPDTGDTTDYSVREDYRVAEEVNSKRDTSPQGMLFSPYAHTGLVQDPTVSSEDRTRAIKKSLGLTDPVDYARRARLKGPAAEGHIAGFVEAINKTDTTMSDIGRTNAVLTGELGRGRGHASFYGGNIVVGVEQAYQKVPIKTVGYEPSDTPIFNEKFWKEGQYEKHNPEAAEYYQDIIQAPNRKYAPKYVPDGESKEHIRWRHPNGTIYTNDDLEELTLGDLNVPIKNRHSKYAQRHEVEENEHVEELDNDSKQNIVDSRKQGAGTGKWHRFHDFDNVDIDNIVKVYASDDTRAPDHDVLDFLETNNIVPNVFPGIGKNTEKHSARIVKLENGPDRRSINADYKTVTWHTRHEPDRTKPTKLPTKMYFTMDEQGNKIEIEEPITHETVPVKNKYVPVTSTLVHEIGHTFEPMRGFNNVRTERVRRKMRNSITDPVAEGYADAHTDRTYYHRGQVEDVFHDVDVRSEKIKNSGYSSEYGNWNATERALYSAVRQHLAANPGDDLAIPNRLELLEHYQIREDVIAAHNHTLARQRRDASRRSGRRTYRYGGHAPTNLDEHYDVHLANKLALGQMWEHLPELRPVLNKLGFGRTASEAHEDYMSRTASQKPLFESAVRNRRRNEPQTADQLSLIPAKTRRKRS